MTDFFLIFGHVTLKKVLILRFWRKQVLSRKLWELERNGRKVGITKGKKHICRKKNYFWSCDLEKSADSAFLAQKGIISEMARAGEKPRKFWDH